MTPIKPDIRKRERKRLVVVDIVVVVTPLRINKTDSLTVDTLTLTYPQRNQPITQFNL